MSLPLLVRAALTRGAVLAGVWWALAEGTGTGWGLGVVVVALAVLVSLRLQPPGGLTPRLRAVPGFALWFARHSVLGGVDVARRAVRRPVDIAPAVLVVPLRVPWGWPTVMLADAISLLPGTLAVTVRPGSLELHVLDEKRDVDHDVRMLEDRIARLYGVRLGAPPVPGDERAG